MTYPTQRLEEVMSNIASNPSLPNLQTQVMRLSEDECRHLRGLMFQIEHSLYDRENIFDKENEND